MPLTPRSIEKIELPARPREYDPPEVFAPVEIDFVGDELSGELFNVV
jgi:hypothetical protein